VHIPYRVQCIQPTKITPPFSLSLQRAADGSGERTAGELAALGVPVTLVPDLRRWGAAMPGCGLVLLGADGVAESGGVVNRVGTFQIAVLAKALGKPLYVAAESFKVHHSAVLFCTLLYCTVLYCAVLCCTVLYCAVL